MCYLLLVYPQLNQSPNVLMQLFVTHHQKNVAAFSVHVIVILPYVL